jgi:hypothetical protein
MPFKNIFYAFNFSFYVFFYFNSFLSELQVCYTCFNRFAILEIKSSSALVFCLGGNFILGFPLILLLLLLCYFEFDFLPVDLDEGGGGIYAWKSLYILSAT